MALSLSTLLLALAGGCREEPIGGAAPAAPAATPPAVTTALPPVDPRVARLPLAERLALELGARPADAVRAEQLELALGERGVSIARRHQVLASPLGASYCELAVSSAGLGVSVCEFADPAGAEAGSVRSRQMFDSMVPGRTLVTRSNTLLTLTRPESDAAQRQAELILTLFSHQTPSALPTQTALAH